MLFAISAPSEAKRQPVVTQEEAEQSTAQKLRKDYLATPEFQLNKRIVLLQRVIETDESARDKKQLKRLLDLQTEIADAIASASNKKISLEQRISKLSPFANYLEQDPILKKQILIAQISNDIVVAARSAARSTNTSALEGLVSSLTSNHLDSLYSQNLRNAISSGLSDYLKKRNDLTADLPFAVLCEKLPGYQNSKPAFQWVMERQAVTTDKKSGIVNDANL